jgi:hypothetical protein
VVTRNWSHPNAKAVRDAEKMMLFGQFVGDWEFDWSDWFCSRSLLYGVTANDPLTFAGVLIFLLLVADKSRVKLSRLHERHLFRALALHAISI